MVVAHEQRHALGEQRLGRQLRMRLPDVRAEAQVGLLREDARNHLLRRAVEQRGRKRRVLLRKTAQHRRQQRARREVAHRQHHAPFAQLRLRAAGADRFVDQPQRAHRRLDHHLARARQLDAAAPHHQRLPELFFHALDQVADGWLGQLQGFGRQREAARFGDRRQRPQLLQRDLFGGVLCHKQR
jgi:hypothetical protein